ncbi:ubiquitin-conjugating enzyme E2 S-like protein [Globomyces pollinis-pini]|nr:ubiquitin-conjugating enzyme E2 S-like protein [Globomyces pollinis-pini]
MEFPIKKITKELKELQQHPIEGITTNICDGDITELEGLIQGPGMGTPFHRGFFKLKISLGNDYPTSPPNVTFLTKIFHPNVSNVGEVCVSTLKKDWKPSVTLSQLLLTIKCLLIVPNPESALNEEAGKLLLEDYEQYDKRAKLMTSIHAMKSKQETSEKTGILTQSNSISPKKRSRESNTLPTVKPKATKVDKKSLRRL